MNELVFIAGVVVGIAGVLAVQRLYAWINKMRNEVEYLRNTLHSYSSIRDEWVEFQRSRQKS